jgi:CopG family transcriptional regulator, nickel-responsive regulator
VSKSGEKVERFGVSAPPELLARFDQRIAEAGYTNRSEAIRDIIRDYLVQREWREPEGEVIGTITLVYDHHVSRVEGRLTDVQHDYHDITRCASHVHIDADNCVEVIVVQGPAARLRELADTLIGTRGVKHGQLVCTTTGAEV